MRNFVLVAALVVFGAGLRADFTYTQTATMTGGTVVTMMRALGPFARGAREPQVSTHIVKGNRMATISKDSISVTDLDKETITNINTDKKTYSVVTFAEMKQAMEKMMARMQQAQAKGKGKGAAPATGATYKMSAKATGQTKTLNGITARQIVLSTDIENQDQAARQAQMNMVLDTWVGSVPGYEEVQAFQRRMGEKMGYAFGSQMAQSLAAQPGVFEGMQQAAEEMAKVEGVPLQQNMKMGASLSGADAEAAPQQNQAASDQNKGKQGQAPPSVGAAAAAAALGRFGGLGRNRNKGNEQKQAEAAPQAQGEPTAQQSASLMEMTTELGGFSSAPVDPAKFEIPRGFKQVEDELVKQSR